MIDRSPYDAKFTIKLVVAIGGGEDAADDDMLNQMNVPTTMIVTYMCVNNVYKQCV
jgi:hypothetical protein